MDNEILPSAASRVLSRANIVPRETQLAALREIRTALASGCRDIIIDAPTGSGKSVLALAAAVGAHSWTSLTDVARGSVIATPQKMLQDQYEEEFEVVTLKGRDNYACPAQGGRHTAKDCLLPTMTVKQASIYEDKNCKSCVYKSKVSAVKQGSQVPAVLNFATLLYLNTYGSTLDTTGVLVIDEAHGVEDALRAFFTLEEDHNTLSTLGDVSDVTSLETAIALEIDLLSEETKEEGLDPESVALIRRRIQELQTHTYRLKLPAGWVITELKTKNGSCRAIKVEPKYLGVLAPHALPPEKFKVRIYLSATIDAASLARTMGVPKDSIQTITMQSTFKVSRRPCLRDVVGSMGRARQDATLPKMVSKINELLSRYDKVRVLVHCVSGELAEKLYEGIGPENHYRLILHKGGDKSKVLEKFSSPLRPNAVILSPSLSEGFNGKDGLCRVNIITKVAYPYLGNEMVKQLAKEQPRWYAECAARAVVQQYGRAVRNSADYGITYILDADFNRLYTNRRDLFPVWFQDAVAAGDRKLGIKDRKALI